MNSNGGRNELNISSQESESEMSSGKVLRFYFRLLDSLSKVFNSVLKRGFRKIIKILKLRLISLIFLNFQISTNIDG
jgi:hypothetical protein